LSLSLIVVGKSFEECLEWSRRNNEVLVDETILLDNRGARFGGLGRIWNLHVITARGTTVGMVHADTVLSDEFLDRVLIETEVNGAVAGIVGRSLKGFYIWSKEQDKTEPVSTLDGCSVFASKSTILKHNLSFDVAAFDSFHCCVEDFCLSAAQAGVPIVVPPGSAEHQGKSTNDHKWLGEYWKYRRLLDEKYPNTAFLTT
jgi:hypothetical protein